MADNMHPLLLLQRYASQRSRDIEAGIVPPEEMYCSLDFWDPWVPLPTNACLQELPLAPLSPASSSSSFAGWNSEPSAVECTYLELPQNLATPPPPFDPQAFEGVSRFLSPDSEMSDDYGLFHHDIETCPDTIPQLSYASSRSSASPIFSSPPHQKAQDLPPSQNHATKPRWHNQTNGRSTSTSEPSLSRQKECPKCGRTLRRSHSTGLYRCGKCGPRGPGRRHDKTVENREDSPSHRKTMQDAAHSKNDSEETFSFVASSMGSVKEDPGLFEMSMCLDNYEPPELIVRGLVSPEEVCQLFEIFFDKMNDAKALDPTIHNIPALVTRCPLLFTVICAIASSALPSRPDLFPIALALAKEEASKALSVREKGPCTSPEADLALKLLARWARRTSPVII